METFDNPSIASISVPLMPVHGQQRVERMFAKTGGEGRFVAGGGKCRVQSRRAVHLNYARGPVSAKLNVTCNCRATRHIYHRMTFEGERSKRRRRLLTLRDVLASSAMAPLAVRPLAAEAAEIPLRKAPLPLPEIAFTDDRGGQFTLRARHGRFVLLNILATGRGPCRAEMPALDRLLTRLGGNYFEVLALSVDRAGINAVSGFYEEYGIRRLRLFNDQSGGAVRKLRIFGLPGTIFVDPQGREISRIIGAVEWDAAGIIAFPRGILQGNQERNGNNYLQKTGG
jgi:thiol-disulfide isomerase/thioredoxin